MASKIGLVSFLKQVRIEASKVTWPSRRETLISMVFVLIMVLMGAIFLFLSDKIVESGVWGIIGFFQHLFN